MSSNALAAIGAALLLVPAAALGPEPAPPDTAPVPLEPAAQRHPEWPAAAGAPQRETGPGGARGSPAGGPHAGVTPAAGEEDLAAVVRRLRTTPARVHGSHPDPRAPAPRPPVVSQPGAPPGDFVPSATSDPTSRPTAGRVDVAPSGWAWPLAPRPAVMRRFDVGPYRWSPGHRGVDLDADPGHEVVAPAGGIVTYARVVVGRPVLVITHPGGIRTSFEPVQAAVPVGTVVRRGDVIGHLLTVGNHCGQTVCLHWGARRGDSYVDPLALLGRPRIVLLPLRPP